RAVHVGGPAGAELDADAGAEPDADADADADPAGRPTGPRVETAKSAASATVAGVRNASHSQGQPPCAATAPPSWSPPAASNSPATATRAGSRDPTRRSAQRALAHAPRGRAPPGCDAGAHSAAPRRASDASA